MFRTIMNIFMNFITKYKYFHPKYQFCNAVCVCICMYVCINIYIYIIMSIIYKPHYYITLQIVKNNAKYS